jgi:hypothetical protein
MSKTATKLTYDREGQQPVALSPAGFVKWPTKATRRSGETQSIHIHQYEAGEKVNEK